MLKNHKILVVGLGDTGISVLEYATHMGIHMAAYDAQLYDSKREYISQRFPNVPLFSGSLKHALAQHDMVILSPGISRRIAEMREFEANGGKIIGDVAIFADLLTRESGKIIAITGSNGKTTTTSLVGHLCEQSGLETVIAGNIGTPVLRAWLERGGKAADVWVLELSSFQLETTENLHVAAACCLNISEDHLDRYSDLLNYAHVKSRIFNGKTVQILNHDDVFCRAMKREGHTTHYFSLHDHADYHWDESSGCLKKGEHIIMPASELLLQGRHNIANVLAALALCESIGLAREQLIVHIATFRGLPHRVEKVAEKNGVIFIDDSKGTNVGATAAAIAGLPHRIWLIAGGVGKGQDFRPLRAVLHDKVGAVFLIGVDAPKIAQDIADCGVAIDFCDTLPQAVQRAFAAASAGDVVLLSPACASFDMFDNYAHRAQVFVKAVHALYLQAA